MKREIIHYIQDINEAMKNAVKFIDKMSYEKFIQDDKTIYAVIRAVEIIGEASKNIPEVTRIKYSEIPWKDMAGMRDKVIHEYFGVNIERVWITIKDDIPRIRPIIIKLLEEFESE